MIKCKHENNGICEKGIKTMCEFCDHFVPDKKIQNRLDMIRNKDDEGLIEILRYYRSVRKWLYRQRKTCTAIFVSPHGACGIHLSLIKCN